MREYSLIKRHPKWQLKHNVQHESADKLNIIKKRYTKCDENNTPVIEIIENKFIFTKYTDSLKGPLKSTTTLKNPSLQLVISTFKEIPEARRLFNDESEFIQEIVEDYTQYIENKTSFQRNKNQILRELVPLLISSIIFLLLGWFFLFFLTPTYIGRYNEVTQVFFDKILTLLGIFTAASTGFLLLLLPVYSVYELISTYRPSKAEKYLQETISQTSTYTQKEISHYIEPGIYNDPIKRFFFEVFYQLKVINPNWDLELCLSPFITKLSLIRAVISVSLALFGTHVGWGMLMSVVANSEEFSRDPIEFIVGRTFTSLVLILTSIVITYFMIRGIYWYYHIREGLIEDQTKAFTEIEIQNETSVEGQLKLLNTHLTLQHLKKSPRYPLSNDFKIAILTWSVFGVLYTVINLLL